MSDLLLNLTSELFQALSVGPMFCKRICAKHPPYGSIGDFVQIEAGLSRKAHQCFLKLKLDANLSFGVHESSPIA